MELSTFIPNNDVNWLIDHDILYYNGYCKIPMLYVSDSRVWIILDMRSIKAVLILVKYLTKKNIKFYFHYRDTNYKNLSSQEEIYINIIKNYINTLGNETFYDNINKIGFDYIKNLTDFLIEYKCMYLFDDTFSILKKKLLIEHYDYYSKSQWYNIPREDIRDCISGLDREIKLNMLI